MGRLNFSFKLPVLFLGYLDEKGNYVLLLPSLETFHLVSGLSYEDIISQFVVHEVIHKLDGRISEGKVLKIVDCMWNMLKECELND